MIQERIDSVMRQSYKDFVYWIFENSTDFKTKDIVHNMVERYHNPQIILVDEYPNRIGYPQAELINKYYDYFKGVIVCANDDDLMKPNALEKIANTFTNPNIMVAYWGQETHIWNGQEFAYTDTRYAKDVVKKGTNVDCMLDGGQIAHRAECLKELTKPYWREEWDNEAAHSDGIFFNRLVNRFDFHPINEVLTVKRTGPKSTFTQK